MAKSDYNIYMEDGTLVQDIYITNVPQDISIADVQNYFSQFGEVSKIKLQLEGRDKLVGCINFVEPLAAAKALVKRDHIISPYEMGITVEAWGRWFEPINCSILCLNNDCLLQICKHLELRDQISFAQTHSRCAAVVQMGEKYKHKRVSPKNLTELTPCQVKEFFRLFGSTVEEIDEFCFGDINGDAIADSMKKYCNNVKLLRLYKCNNLCGRLSKLLLRMQQITELHLRCCSLEDEDFPDMPNLTTLKILFLDYNDFIFCAPMSSYPPFLGTCFSRLTTVQHLYLDYRSEITPRLLINAIKSMKMLRSMHLELDENVSSDLLREMAKSCHKLEVLKIPFGHNVEYECLAQLPSLKVLELFRIGVDSPMRCHKLLKALVTYKAHQLVYLDLKSQFLVVPEDAVQLGLLEQLKHLKCSCYCNLNDQCLREFANLRHLEELVISCSGPFTAGGLLHLLGQCTKLMVLNITGYATITNTFVYQAIDVLGRVTAERNGPVVIYVDRTGISETILKESRYMNAASLLELSFGGYPKPLDLIKFCN